MVDFDGLQAKLRWLINEIDDVRASAVRMQHALEVEAQAANGAEKPRIAPVAALSPILAPRDTPTLVRLSEPHTSNEWMARRGNIPLVVAFMDETRGQAGL